LFDHDIPTVRMFAAIALKRLGQRSVETALAKWLASEVPDVRLLAAEAYTPGERLVWLPFVRELRTNANELVRLRAAERLACCDAATAKAILFDALASPNPLLRGEAARVFDEKQLADARVARRLMGDPFPPIQLRGARAAVRLANVATR
jgi:HEAT repeat protein